MLKEVKVRLYSTNQYKESLAKAFGSLRWWNRFLALTNETSKQPARGLSPDNFQKQLPFLHKDDEGLTETYSQCLPVVCLTLSGSFINFFKKRASFRSFKSKPDKQSRSYPQTLKIPGDRLVFPKLGEIYAKIHRPRGGNIKTVTLSINKVKQYFAAILFERCREDFHPKLSRRIVNENQVIICENINIQGMIKTHCLAPSIVKILRMKDWEYWLQELELQRLVQT